MSGEAEKVTHQELGLAPPASSTDVGETPKTTGISSVANGDVDPKTAGENGKAGQVTPAAPAGSVEPLIAAPSSTAPAPASSSLAELESSKEHLASSTTEPSGQPKAICTEPVTSPVAPTIASIDTVTNGITEDAADTTDTPQKTAEAVAPDASAKPTETVPDKVEEDAKNDIVAHVPVVSANGNTRDNDIEMGEAPTAPDDAGAAKAVENAPSLGSGKRKAEEAFEDSNGDLGEMQAQPEVSTTNAVNEDVIPAKRPRPGRPRKQQKERKILTPVGRTARKTRSQGPV
ncbi:hypothetical protein QBC36DRAFT_5508 [Triangularia setosa]|uniref:Uncharacterized protein n=1 Tax=Triangularia setosa TaxID=2587417 RepID=A0AAN7A629_9PEZI|nr:hypothetical protein QBC36DRAFT_5508 [Podospora setosa]